MATVVTPAIILATLRYGDTSKIVRLATEQAGVQSAIAKGALRPGSRFGAALQVLSDGQAHLILHARRELQLLTAFDLARVRVGLTADMGRYAAAAALAEVTLRFAPSDPHPEVYHTLTAGLNAVEQAAGEGVESAALRALWGLVTELGFGPELTACVRDGTELDPGPLAFSAAEGGALCARCARQTAVARLGVQDRTDLEALAGGSGAMPQLSRPQAAAHRRLLSRYISHHLADGGRLPALQFWMERSWEAA